MRLAAVVVALGAAGPAAAQPALEPAVEPPAPFRPYFELAARAGIGAVWVPDQIFDRSGDGPYVELEVARRTSPGFSLAGFASYLTIADGASDGDFGYMTTYTRDRMVHLGARARWHLLEGAVLLGAGAGVQLVRSSYTDECVNPSSPPCVDPAGRMLPSYYETFAKWQYGAFAEGHVGVALPKLGGVVAIQLFATLIVGTVALGGTAGAGVGF